MSGLEPLAALGLACNILQLIEVGCNTITLAKNIYQRSSPVVDQTLQDNAAVLSTISEEVKATKRPLNPSRLDKQLVTTADKCSTAAGDLEEEVRFLLSNAKQNQLAATLKVVAKTTWRKRRLDRLRENLGNIEKLMTSTLLAQIWSRTRATELNLSNAKEELRAFIHHYQSGIRDVKQLVSNESLMTRLQISAEAKKQIEAIGCVQKQMTRLTVEADAQVDQTKRERLLQSLKFPAFNERRNQVSQAHESTFEWIFIGDDDPLQDDLDGSDPEDSEWEDSELGEADLADPSEVSWDLFSNWLSSTSDVYWVSGKPGSGKTTLVKYVMDHPRTITSLNTWLLRVLIISHYFWRPGNAMQQNLKGLLCSLLYQLLDNSLAAAKYVLQDIQVRSLGAKDKDSDWSIQELRSILFQILSSYERPICMFIDGLDEVHPNEGPVELLDLILRFPRCGDIKLCLSSRPEPILEELLSGNPHLRVQDLTRPDLERFARDHIKLTGSASDEALLKGLSINGDLIELLVSKAEGVFLWLILAIKSINKGFKYGDTSEMIRQRIDALPGDLMKLYQDMWNRVYDDSPVAYRQIAALYFRLVLRGQDDPRKYSTFTSSLLHLTLASTALADQVLEAVDSPPHLVPEETMLEHCKLVEMRLKLCCFGLIEATDTPLEDGVIGWYGSQYNTLWTRYGRRRLHFIHRTAQDFLLDTTDGADILKHDSTSEPSLFFAWARGYLAISMLFAGGLPTVTSNAYEYIALFDRFPPGVTCSGDSDRSRTISYFETLCHSGQLLIGRDNERCLCRGVDFLKAAARIQDEHLLSRTRLSTFSKGTISEILFNIVQGGPGGDYSDYCKNSADPLIGVLLSQGADPNYRGLTFQFDGRIPPRLSDVRTPFIEYLNAIMWNERFRVGKQPIARQIKNLHLFLSHSASLSDTTYQVFHCGSNVDGIDFGHWEANVHTAVDRWQKESVPLLQTGQRFSLVVAFPSCTLVKILLGKLGDRLEHTNQGKGSDYGETISLLTKSREYLDNWSKWDDSHVIGKLGIGEGLSRDPFAKGVWYVPKEGSPKGITRELMKELEKCLLERRDWERRSESSLRLARIRQFVQQLPWMPCANGLHDTCESLAQLGILIGRDVETRDLQGWVDEFQKGLSTKRGC